MSRSTSTREFNSRWLNWTPDEKTASDPPKPEPSEPTKPSSDGFVGSYSAHLQKIGVEVGSAHAGSVGSEGSYPGHLQEIEPQADSAALARARAVLDAAGVIALDVDGAKATGVWSDLDGPGIREALRAIGAVDVPVRYLDAPSTPDRCKSRWVRGEAVPLAVLTAMDGSPEPWKVRDALLTEMGWRASRG